MGTSAIENIPGPTKTRIGYWLGKGWDWLLEDLGACLLVGLLAALFLAVSQSLLYGPVAALLASVGLRRAEVSGAADSSNGEAWSQRLQEDFSAALRCFLPALLSGLLILLFSAVGLVFLIVPGIVIFTMYLFTFHFIVDKGEDFWQAMESSRRLVSRDYLGFSLFTLLLAAVNVLGLLFFGVGVVLTIMVSSLAVTAAYRDCTGSTPEPELLPPPAPIVID